MDAAARTAFYTLRGPFAHLQTTPLRWRARNVVIVMSEMSVTNGIRQSFLLYILEQDNWWFRELPYWFRAHFNPIFWEFYPCNT